MLRTVYTMGSALLAALMLSGCNSTSVDLSGDGSQVAVSHGGALYVADIEKENWRKVPLEGASAGSPSWSPDGRYVLFELQPKMKETTSADTSTDQARTEQAKTEEAHAALFDTQTGTTTPLAPDVGLPFAWRSDSSGFVALQKEGENRKIAWFGLDGAAIRAVPLIIGILEIKRLVWLPGSEDVAFLALSGDEETLSADIFRTEQAHVRQITEEGDIVGIGSDSEHGRLLWARSWLERREIRMELYRYDPSNGSVTRLRYPEKLAFVQPEPGADTSVESVAFSSNGERMAIVVQASTASKREEEPDHMRSACYSAETDASGARLIRQTEPDGGSFYPAWSRDGRRLVILDSSGETPRLWVYNYDGTGKHMAPLPTEQAKEPVTR